MAASNSRILYLCADRGIPFGGSKGGSIHVREFLEALAATEFSPEVVVCRRDETSEYNPVYPLHVVEPGVSDAFFEDVAHFGYNRRTLREVRDFYRNQAVESCLEDLFGAKNFGLMYERYSLFGVAGRMVSRERGIPHVLEVNAPLVREASEFRQLHLLDLAKAVEKLLFSTTDHVIAVSEAVAQYVRAIAADTPITVVPNGVDPRPHLALNDAAKDKRGNDIPGREFVIGFVGSIRPWHGVDVLIEALSLLQKAGVAARVRLVGDNHMVKESLESRCEKLGVTESVEFMGAVPFESVPSILSGIDILAAPYPEMDGFYFSPLKVFEYMAAGKPIVASGIGQITDILTHETNALLVPPGDSAALADALMRLRNDSDLRAALGHQARRDALEQHTWARRLEQITAVFNQLGCGAQTVQTSRSCG